MNTYSLSERHVILNLCGAMLWSDFKPSAALLRQTAAQLSLTDDPILFDLMHLPPLPEDVDPTALSAEAYETTRALLEELAQARPTYAAREFLELFEALGGSQSMSTMHSQGMPRAFEIAAA
jgi:hypothetical protein